MARFIVFYSNSIPFSLISESARNRADWYSYFFKPVSSLTHHSFFGSSEPLWGYYPHNLFLDSLGHFGILYFAFVVFFSFFLAYYFLSRFSALRSSSSFFLFCLFMSILLGSFVSGTHHDYYPLNALLLLFMRERN